MNKNEYKKQPKTVPYEEYLRIRNIAQRLREEKKQWLDKTERLNEEIVRLMKIIEDSKK